MNVSVHHKLYLHTIVESYKNIEWLRVTTDNVLFKDSDMVTHVIPIKKIIDFSVTQ